MRIVSTIRLRVGVIALVAVLCLPCFATDVAVLRNGFAIRHERREIVGSLTRLYTTEDGVSFVDVPTSEIEHFEVAPEDPATASLSAPTSPPFAKNAKDGAPTPVTAANSNAADLSDVVNEASGRYRLDPDLVNSVIKAESGFNVRAVSRKGAQGLMQLMPGTASQLGVPNAFDPAANVDGGARYLRELLERYNFDLVKALAAYNAGTKRVEQYGGVPPYYETRAYVRRIVLDFNKKKLAQKSAVAAQKKASAGKPKAAAAGRSAPQGETTSSLQVIE
jgi:hypothetical protein